MTLDEKAINAVNDYFAAISQNAIDQAYERTDDDTTFAEFMELVLLNINQFSAEHVASEVLELSPKAIDDINDGGPITTDDIQGLIEIVEQAEDEDY